MAASPSASGRDRARGVASLILLAAIVGGCVGARANLATARGNAMLPAPATDRGALAAGEINDFAFDLLRNLDPQGNLCVSPASIALALGMVRPGARGQTATEMDKVLHSFGSGNQAAEISALLHSFRSQNLNGDWPGAMPGVSGTGSRDDPAVELDVSNDAFVQKDLAIDQEYLDAVSSGFDAGIGLVDYKNDTETARLLINKWAAEQTKGRIPSILRPGDLDTLTRLVLVDAIYLKAVWQTRFDRSLTQPKSFTTATGSAVQTPTMATDGDFQYASGPGYRAIDLPYALGGLAMTIVVPDDMASFVSGLTAGGLAAIVAAESKHEADLELPRFSIDDRVDLASALSGMGMPTAFDMDKADFSGITAVERLYLMHVIHEADIDVMEEGTTASAVTTAVIEASATPPPVPKVSLHVDRPFLYFIRDTRSGAVLFMGRVDDPSK